MAWRPGFLTSAEALSRLGSGGMRLTYAWSCGSWLCPSPTGHAATLSRTQLLENLFTANACWTSKTVC